MDYEYYYTSSNISAPMPKSPGGLVVRASDWYAEVPGLIFFPFIHVHVHLHVLHTKLATL